MSSKKAPAHKNLEPPGDEPASALDGLEVHISQRINALQPADEQSNTALPAEAENEPGLESIPQFEPFERYEFAALNSADHAFAGGYEKVRETYQESAELLKCVHSLSDQLTDALLSLNIRLTDLEEKMRDLSTTQMEQLKKLKLEIIDGQKKISVDPCLQKQLKELISALPERQSAFLNLLDTQIKTLGKSPSRGNEHLNRNFFILAALLIILSVIAGTLTNSSIDRLNAYVCQELDALRAAVTELMEAHSPEALP